jgi:predicted Na+-dependent transporter
MWVTQEPKNDMTPYAALSHFFHSRRIITSDYRDGGSPNNFTQASNISLLFLMVLMVVLNFSNVVGLFGSGGLLVSLILVIVSAAGAYLLGSLGRAQKWVQTFGAGQRNIAAAMVVTTMNFGNDEVVMVVV